MYGKKDGGNDEKGRKEGREKRNVGSKLRIGGK